MTEDEKTALVQELIPRLGDAVLEQIKEVALKSDLVTVSKAEQFFKLKRGRLFQAVHNESLPAKRDVSPRLVSKKVVEVYLNSNQKEASLKAWRVWEEMYPET